MRPLTAPGTGFGLVPTDEHRSPIVVLASRRQSRLHRSPVSTRCVPSISMTFSGWLATRWARRRWVAALPVVLLVAVGATGATLALSSAQRTATAYDDYLASRRR